LDQAFNNIFVNASSVSAADFNGDGAMDLFISGRSIPMQYGENPRSYLLQNDGAGHFTDVSEKYAKDLADIGMITQAIWFDINKDGTPDLLICTEWDGIYALLNNKGTFVKKIITDKKGWWNFILPVDLDNDGDIDLIAGNLGLNSRLQASDTHPVKIYYNDFDDNGKKEQILTYFIGDRELPFANKDELQKQIPFIKKKYLYAADFAQASLSEIFGKQKLNDSKILTANYFSNSILINQGNLNFELKAMPWKAQLSPFRDAIVVDANHDNLPDILLVGNYYANNIQMGRYDADFGTILLNKGKGVFTAENVHELPLKGEGRHIRKVTIGGKESYIIAKNNDSTQLIQFSDELIKK
jgi:hypothetical protein